MPEGSTKGSACERRKIFIFPVADGTVQISGGDRRLRTSTLIRDRPERGEEHEVRRGKSDELSSPTLDDADAEKDHWSTTGDLTCRHHVEPRVKMYVPKEETFPVPMKYIDVSRNTHTPLDAWTEKDIDDCCNVDGDRQLSDAWTGFTRFILVNERPLDRFSWSGRRLTRKQTTSRHDNVWPDMWKHMSDASKRKAKQKWIIEKPNLDNARKLRGVFFIEPDDEEFKRTMKNARRNLDIPTAMPCKTPTNGRRETSRSIGKHKTNYACVVDADESMRIRLEGVPQRYHEDHIAAKGINSLSHYNLVHKFVPMLQARCKGSSGKRMGKTSENTGMAADESQK